MIVTIPPDYDVGPLPQICERPFRPEEISSAETQPVSCMRWQGGREGGCTIAQSWLLPQSTPRLTSVVSPVTRNLTNPLGPTCVPPSPFTSTWPHQQVTTNKHILLFRAQPGTIRLNVHRSVRDRQSIVWNLYFISSVYWLTVSFCTCWEVWPVRGSYSASLDLQLLWNLLWRKVLIAKHKPFLMFSTY